MSNLTKNAGLLFYREYYNQGDLAPGRLEAFVETGKLLVFIDKDKTKREPKDKQFFVEASQELINLQWGPQMNQHFTTGQQQFTLKTIYPGLLIGTGYSHQTGSTGEFKSGFYFDYTTGLPVIPGSSVKGVLRSVFPGRDKSENGVVKTMKTKFIRSLLKSVGGPELTDDKDIITLEKAIFEGLDEKDHPLPMHRHDVFHDAFICNADREHKILEEDFITPHGENPLKNPTPVRFLKIRGGVSFQFCFDLKDTEINGRTVTAAQKKELFLRILKKTGIGAKTNTGYGHFE